ncbi:MAG: hypothetical protein ACOYL6_16975 [Bacteriovoracaceae bacterium]
MIFQKNFLTIGLSVLVLTVGCTNSGSKYSAHDHSRKMNEEATGRNVNYKAAVEAGAHNYVQIDYKEGSSHLSDDAKSSLRNVVNEAKSEGKIDEVIVLSWSDENYPSKNLNKLSKEQRGLADRRNNNVKEYLKTLNKLDVDTYNMAERPSSLSKLFNTEDTKLKTSFIRAGISTNNDSNDYATKASHSVILIKLQ